VLKQYSIKTYGEVEEKLHALLTKAVDGGEWLASRPAHLTPWERVSSNRWLERRALLEAVNCGGYNASSLVRNKLLCWLSYPYTRSGVAQSV
jgi:hypothetical protein